MQKSPVAIKWSEVKERCSPNTIKILEHLAQNGSISNAIAREITGLSSPEVRKILSRLAENKIVSLEGDKNRVYIFSGRLSIRLNWQLLGIFTFLRSIIVRKMPGQSLA